MFSRALLWLSTSLQGNKLYSCCVCLYCIYFLPYTSSSIIRLQISYPQRCNSRFYNTRYSYFKDTMRAKFKVAWQIVQTQNAPQGIATTELRRSGRFICRLSQNANAKVTNVLNCWIIRITYLSLFHINGRSRIPGQIKQFKSKVPRVSRMKFSKRLDVYKHPCVSCCRQLSAQFFLLLNPQNICAVFRLLLTRDSRILRTS